MRLSDYMRPQILVLDAGQQRRTPIIGRTFYRPGRVPSKAAGRRGTRRNWKRQHPPRLFLSFAEPEDVLTFERDGRPFVVATPRQARVIEAATEER